MSQNEKGTCREMIRYLLLILVIITITPGHLHSANNETTKDIGVSLSIGVSPGGQEKGHYQPAPNTTISTTFTFGAGIHYRSILLLYGTKLNISAESYYYCHSTNPVDLMIGDATVRYTGYSVPILVWAEFMTRNRFGPFVKLGLGAIWTDWKDECSSELLFSPHHKFWSFSYGMGAGIYYSPKDTIDIICIVQGVVCVKESVVVSENGREHTLYAPWGFNSYNLSIRYWF